MSAFAQMFTRARNKDTARENVLRDILALIQSAKVTYAEDWAFTYDLIKAEALIVRELGTVQERWKEQ